ncbi:hypothetical protein H5V45_16410 [Nocardioides sp. KIGAM211]|uniref:Peptidase C39-like domain-containing protein n=1 Tax=Nocardioides luti TaxID=2761101 RepID=A0A7X0RII7_9ACTN|nr:hypothetical protein [Nocardioides luti]MBB6628912.1 hypothetical protein [Nocardioides luti]
MSGPDQPDWPAVAFRERLRQPDQRSCGATVLVVARMLLDPAYAQLVATGRHPRTGVTLAGDVAGRFRYEVLGMHHRVTGAVDAAGHLQVPWPRALGTPPWAVAHQMSTTGGADLPPVRYVARPVRPGGAGGADRGRVFDRLLAVTGDRRPVPVYVGDRWLPRHVVLALGPVEGRLRCYEPARGQLVDVDRASFTGARLGLAGWDRPWCVVVPA